MQHRLRSGAATAGDAYGRAPGASYRRRRRLSTAPAVVPRRQRKAATGAVAGGGVGRGGGVGACSNRHVPDSEMGRLLNVAAASQHSSAARCEAAEATRIRRPNRRSRACCESVVESHTAEENKERSVVAIRKHVSLCRKASAGDVTAFLSGGGFLIYSIVGRYNREYARIKSISLCDIRVRVIVQHQPAMRLR